MRHHLMVDFGELKELTVFGQKQQLAKRVVQLILNYKHKQQDLFVPNDDIVEQLAQYFFKLALQNERMYLASGKHKELAY